MNILTFVRKRLYFAVGEVDFQLTFSDGQAENLEQECIPVGCVPTAAVTATR